MQMGTMRNDPTLPQYDHLLEGRFGLNGVPFFIYQISDVTYMDNGFGESLDFSQVTKSARLITENSNLSQRIRRYPGRPSDLIHPECQHKSRNQP